MTDCYVSWNELNGIALQTEDCSFIHLLIILFTERIRAG